MREPETRICVICNKEFTTLHTRKKTCSDVCSYELMKKNSNAYYKKLREDKKSKGISKTKLTLAQLNALARSEGMSYGFYTGINKL